MEASSWHCRARWIQSLVVTLAAWFCFASARADIVIYDDAIAPGWQNWSWAVTDTANSQTVHSGAVSMAVTPAAWSAAYLRSAAAPVDTSGLLNLTFWVNGGASGGQRLQVVAVVNDVAQPALRLPH